MPVQFLYSFSLQTQAYPLASLSASFDDMKAVTYNSGVGGCLSCYGTHAIGKVHRNAFDHFTLIRRQLHEHSQDISRIRSLDYRNDCALAAMGILVVDNGIQLALEGCLVYAMFLACVLRQKDPFGGMFLLLPCLEGTRCALISLRKRGAVYHVCITYLMSGYRLFVHPLSFKKARSLSSIACLDA